MDGWQDCRQGLQSGGKVQLGGALRGRLGLQRLWGPRDNFGRSRNLDVGLGTRIPEWGEDLSEVW